MEPGLGNRKHAGLRRKGIGILAPVPIPMFVSLWFGLEICGGTYSSE